MFTGIRSSPHWAHIFLSGTPVIVPGGLLLFVLGDPDSTAVDEVLGPESYPKDWTDSGGWSIQDNTTAFNFANGELTITSAGFGESSLYTTLFGTLTEGAVYKLKFTAKRGLLGSDQAVVLQSGLFPDPDHVHVTSTEFEDYEAVFTATGASSVQLFASEGLGGAGAELIISSFELFELISPAVVGLKTLALPAWEFYYATIDAEPDAANIAAASVQLLALADDYYRETHPYNPDLEATEEGNPLVVSVHGPFYGTYVVDENGNPIYVAADAWNALTDDTKLLAYWSTSDATSFTLDENNKVITITDKKNGLVLNATGEGKRPLTGVRDINGVPIFDYDGVDFLKLDDYALPTSGNYSVSYIFIVDSIAGNTTSSVLSMSANSTNSVNKKLDWQYNSNSSSQFKSALTHGLAGVVTVQPSTDLLDGEPHLITLIFDFDSNKVRMRLDGIEVADGPYTTQIFSNQFIRLFSNRSGSEEMNGAGGDFYMTEAVDPDTILKIEGQINDEYFRQQGIDDSLNILDSTHPYKTSVPQSADNNSTFN